MHTPTVAAWRTARRAAVVAAALAAGCYHPVVPEGAPCTTSTECPTSQRCWAGACRVHEPEVDAGATDAAAAVDAAAIDAAPLACTTAGLTCAGTATVFTCGGHCWVRCTSNVSRELARAACVGWQGALGQIDDAVEESCVTSHLTAASWLGLLQRPTATATTDDWTWNDSAPVVYTRWQTGKPDDRDGKETGEEQCAKIQTDGTWDDVACTSSLDFVCERP